MAEAREQAEWLMVECLSFEDLIEQAVLIGAEMFPEKIALVHSITAAWQKNGKVQATTAVANLLHALGFRTDSAPLPSIEFPLLGSVDDVYSRLPKSVVEMLMIMRKTDNLEEADRADPTWLSRFSDLSAAGRDPLGYMLHGARCGLTYNENHTGLTGEDLAHYNYIRLHQLAKLPLAIETMCMIPRRVFVFILRENRLDEDLIEIMDSPDCCRYFYDENTIQMIVAREERLRRIRDSPFCFAILQLYHASTISELRSEFPTEREEDLLALNAKTAPEIVAKYELAPPPHVPFLNYIADALIDYPSNKRSRPSLADVTFSVDPAEHLRRMTDVAIIEMCQGIVDYETRGELIDGVSATMKASSFFFPLTRPLVVAYGTFIQYQTFFVRDLLVHAGKLHKPFNPELTFSPREVDTLIGILRMDLPDKDNERLLGLLMY